MHRDDAMVQPEYPPPNSSGAHGLCLGYSSGGSRKKYLGAWPLIIWEATTAKRNY